MKIINVKKKKMIPLTHTVLESCAVLSQESCHVCKKKFEDKYANDKNIEQLENNVIIQLNTEVLDIASEI